MSEFSDAELEYLNGDRRLGRLATVGKDGTPHVVPVGWSYNAEADAIEVTTAATIASESKNYDDSFETVRDGCGDGWVVFEIPQSSQADKVTFGFEDTGTSQHPETQVDAKFSWTVSD